MCRFRSTSVPLTRYVVNIDWLLQLPATWLDTREIPIADLTRFPGNARRGNVDEIRASIRRNGQYRSLVVREVGEGELLILAGNHTRDALHAEGRATARCEVISCTEAEGRRINLADNRLSDIATDDPDSLAELLSYMDGDYEGTGWDDESVEQLLHPEGDDGDDGDDEHGELLKLAGVTIGNPRHQVEHGQIWALGDHRLAVGDLFTDWPLWAPLLEGDAIFMPYPTPLLPHAPHAAKLVMVQPIPFLAGHLLDKWENITGQDPVVVNGRSA